MGLKGKFLNRRGFYKADGIGSVRKKKEKKESQVQEEMEPGKKIRFR